MRSTSTYLPRATSEAKQSHTARMVLISSILLVFGIGIISAAVIVSGQTVTFHMIFAMLLGSVLTSAIGVGLMALSFHSSREGYDRLGRFDVSEDDASLSFDNGVETSRRLHDQFDLLLPIKDNKTAEITNRVESIQSESGNPVDPVLPK